MFGNTKISQKAVAEMYYSSVQAEWLISNKFQQQTAQVGVTFD